MGEKDIPTDELRVLKNEDDEFDVLDGNGYAGCYHSFTTKEEAEAWLEGYEDGCRENM